MFEIHPHLAALEQALDVRSTALVHREFDCPACDGQGFHDDYAECDYCCGIGVVLS